MKYRVNITINLISNVEIDAIDRADAIGQAKALINADATIKGIQINEPGKVQAAKKNGK